MEKEVPNNFTVPKYQLASIYQGLHRLMHQVRKSQFFMTKTDRRIYGDRAQELALQCIKDFCIAFDFQDERPHYYMMLVGDVHALMSLVDEIRDGNILKCVSRDLRDTRTQLPKSNENMYLQLYDEIGKIDSDIGKWRAVALRSKPSNENP